MCSASSFGLLLQLGRHSPVVLVGAAAPARPGDRPRDDLAVEQLHHRLGRRADDRDLRVTQEVHVRARVHLPQHAVDVERIGVEIDVVALREHDLEDVAVEDVLLGDLDRSLVHAVGHRASARPATPRRPAAARRGTYGSGWASRSSTAAATRTHRGVVGVVEIGTPSSSSTRHALDQVHTLAPVVERRQRTDDAHHGVGQSAVVGGHVGQALDLADHVVAEVAHHPAVQRRQVGDHRARVDRAAARRARRASRGRVGTLGGQRRRRS